jgi:hypothetical protein
MADFTSYDQIVKWIAKGKNPAEGRKKRSFMFRMQEDVVVVSHAQRWATRRPDGSWDYTQLQWRLIDFAEITPGDVITFTLDAAEMRKIAASMSSTFWRVLGLSWVRVGTGRYNIAHYDSTRYKSLYGQYTEGPKYEFFKGMMWEFARGICINPRPPILKKVDREQRKVWCSDLKKFRRLFLTKVKLGVVQKIIEEKPDTGKRVYEQELPDAILDAIKTGDAHTDLIERLVVCAKRQYYHTDLTSAAVAQYLRSVINSNSVRYRQEYGVLQK